MIRSSGQISKTGIFDYNDVATLTTPISVTGGAGYTILTNDGAGPFTNLNYRPAGITNIWNTGTNRFSFAGLSLGDTVDMRLDVEVMTTSPNQSIETALTLGFGAGGQYDIPWSTQTIVKLVSATRVVQFNSVYMGDTVTLNNPAVFRIRSDSNCTVKVFGWYVRVIRR